MSAPAQEDEDDAPDAVLEAAFEDYAEAGLRLPPVPRELVAELDEFGPWQYGTIDCDLTDREAFLAVALDPKTPPFVAFGHTGHGQASWYLSYQLVRGPLAVFVRQSFGSPYDEDEALALTIVNRTVEAIEALVVHADAAQESGRLKGKTRALVVIDTVEPSGFQIGQKGKWIEHDTPVSGVLEQIGLATV